MSPNQVVEVVASSDELKLGTWNDSNSRRLLEALHKDGIILLKDIISADHLDAINKYMAAEAEQVQSSSAKNFDAGNIQQSPPFLPETLFFDDVYINKLLFRAVTLYLGDGAKWDFVSGNTALPKSATRQPVHSDADFEHPNCPFYAVANIPLISSNVATGATEIWLGGTHLGNVSDQEDASLVIKQELVSARQKIRPPVQPTIPKGSLILRDLRLWHAGMPNQSAEMRCMIGLGFGAAWYHNETSFRVPAGTQIPQRIVEGTEKTGIVPKFRVLAQDEYTHGKNLHDFTFHQA